MNDERTTLAKKVKNFRKENNINQFEFAEDCGISDGLVSMIERKNTNVTLDTMQLLAARMGVSVADLFTNSEQVTYCLIPTPICIENIEALFYGIGALKGNIMLDYILDVTDDYNALMSLVEACNEAELEPIHLQDVIENFLAE